MSRNYPVILGGDPLSDCLIRIARPVFPPVKEFAQSFDKALASGQVTNQGPAVQFLEQALSDYVGTPAVVFNNGQSAIMTMLRAAGIEDGEVIVPSYTFSATPHAVKWVGAKPVFADVVSRTDLTIDPNDVSRKITSKTRAIMGVEVYGLPCHYDALEAIGEEYGIKVLFDSAPAFGSRMHGRPIGGRGDAQAFSFHATKPFTTMEGGAIFSNNSELLRRSRSIRNFGQGDGSDCHEIGLNGKMTEVCALVGMELLPMLDKHMLHRNKIANIYRKGLDGIQGLSLASPVDAALPNWFYFPILIDPLIAKVDSNAVVHALEADNIFVRKYFELPCHELTCYKSDRVKTVLANTEWLAKNVISLPVFNDMEEFECQLVIDSIRRIIRYGAEVQAAFSGLMNKDSGKK